MTKNLTNKEKIKVCQNCHLEWRDSLPSDQQIKKIYTRDYFSQKESLTKGYPDYDLFLSSFEVYFSDQLRRLNKYLPNRGRLIEVGCGIGVFLHLARKNNYQVLGIDINKSAKKMAWKRYQVKVLIGEVGDVSLKEKNYDAVVLFQTIEHIKYPITFLKNLSRILRPNGIVLITTPNSESLWKKLLKNNWFSYKHQEHLTFWNEKALKIALLKSNFKDIDFYSDDIRWYSLKQLITLTIAYGGRKFAYLRYLRFPNWLDFKIPFPVGSIGLIARNS
ncbi:class I SAM-dependent methyltransferase [Candidatus Daviesbacteria bacterium]|nr:class I SAM-dependent methyltransferase [Candidatus Daviesbacteria bacterium]